MLLHHRTCKDLSDCVIICEVALTVIQPVKSKRRRVGCYLSFLLHHQSHPQVGATVSYESYYLCGVKLIKIMVINNKNSALHY